MRVDRSRAHLASTKSPYDFARSHESKVAPPFRSIGVDFCCCRTSNSTARQAIDRRPRTPSRRFFREEPKGGTSKAHICGRHTKWAYPVLVVVVSVLRPARLGFLRANDMLITIQVSPVIECFVPKSLLPVWFILQRTPRPTAFVMGRRRRRRRRGSPCPSVQTPQL